MVKLLQNSLSNQTCTKIWYLYHNLAQIYLKFIAIMNFGALLDHVIKYTQYFSNQSQTETLTRSNSTNHEQFKDGFYLQSRHKTLESSVLL